MSGARWAVIAAFVAFVGVFWVQLHNFMQFREQVAVERVQFAEQAAAKQAEYQTTAANYQQQLDRLSTAYEQDINRINSQHSSELRDSEARAGAYSRLSETCSADLAKHTERLDRVVTDGRQVVERLKIGIRQRDAVIDTMRQKIDAEVQDVRK